MYYHLLSCSDMDECLSNPCQNGGTCQDGASSYTCVCPQGYKGMRCDNGKYVQVWFLKCGITNRYPLLWISICNLVGTFELVDYNFYCGI